MALRCVRSLHGNLALPVIQYDIGPPEFLGRDVQALNAAVVDRVPRQTKIIPRLDTNTHTHSIHVVDTLYLHRSSAALCGTLAL